MTQVDPIPRSDGGKATRVRVRRPEYVREARDALTRLDGQTRSFVRERPITALIAAVVAGYMAARLASRVR
jgi:hypothetical protein